MLVTQGYDYDAVCGTESWDWRWRRLSVVPYQTKLVAEAVQTCYMRMFEPLPRCANYVAFDQPVAGECYEKRTTCAGDRLLPKVRKLNEFIQTAEREGREESRYSAERVENTTERLLS